MFGRPSQNSQTSIVNFTVTHTFALIYPVRPAKRSPVSIPTFEVKTDKGPVRVAAVNFSIGDATVGNSGISVDDIASAKLAVPQESVWAGEVFPVTYNLNVVRRYFHSLATNIDWPAGPLVAEDWSKPDPSEALVRGERRVVSVQSTRAYAKQPGTYPLKPASQMINLLVGASGFGLFSQPTVEQRQIDSNPLTLTVKPLPPAPAGFSSVVGDFTFTSKVIPTTGAVGEPITWTVELAGTGNWPDISGLPQREVSNDFQVVQPKSKRTMKEGALFDGTLSEDVVLVPTKPGIYRLAPVRFTYFDPKSGAYQTIASEPVAVTVTAGPQPAALPAGANAPVQFSLNPPAASAAAAPAQPAATPPVPPENLPRESLTESARGLLPFKPEYFWLVAAAPAAGLVLLGWLVLAALHSRQNDPERRRREAKARLTAVIAELRAAALLPGDGQQGCNPQLHLWQTHAAALWEVPHAAPGAPLLHAYVTARERDAAAGWARLWAEADRTRHGRAQALPPDWINRADSAVKAARVPGWAPSSLFATRHLLPFLFTLVLLLAPVIGRAEAADEAYRNGDFAAAEAGWRKSVVASPADWTIRHDLGLALAQQDRWAEATAYWTGAFLLNARSETTRADLALGLQHSGLAPDELVELSRGHGRFGLARWASPGEWQAVLIAAALLLAGALLMLLLQGYRRAGTWVKPLALATSLLAVLLAAAATLSLRTYGPLAHPEVALIWKPAVLRSIPTDVDTTQKTSALSAGSLAVAEKTFLGWTKLKFPGGQTGWVRTEELIKLYR